MKKLPLKYFQDDDVVGLARDLIGKCLFTKMDGILTGGIIVETEAYRAPEDKASHAFGGRRTRRNEAMYGKGGTAYVYKCYGIHSLFNIVTNKKEIPHAILIRAIKPTHGIDLMLKRRGKAKVDKALSGGPGTLSQALGIDVSHNRMPLNSLIWLEDHQISLENIQATPRIGIDYAGEDALLPWRFVLTR